MERIDFRSAAPDAIVSTLLRQGAVLLGHCVDPAALSAAYDVMLKGYEQIERKHIQPPHLRELGLPMYSEILFSQRHDDVLGRIFGDRQYQVDADTTSRRLHQVREPPYWGTPLAPHLDAFVNRLQFTVNFWIPFQECGVEAPSLGVILASFDEIVAYTGYRNGAEVWVDPEPFKNFSRFRPAMKAMTVNMDPAVIGEMNSHFAGRVCTPHFVPGDAMLLTNWSLHFTHVTPSMTKRRENLELRFSSDASLDEILREHGIAMREASDV
jgi:hypothetical protein